MAMKTILFKSSFLAVLIGALLVLKPDASAIAKSISNLSFDLVLVGLHHFPSDESEGVWPTNSKIIGNDGYLYGTTLYGGNGSSGTFYKLTATGDRYNPTLNYTVLHHFSDGNVTDDGEYCNGKLAKDGSGYIYGTCEGGGAYGNGTVYRINTSNGAVTILHHFGSISNDGYVPVSGVVRDPSSGIIYGTTPVGGGVGCSSAGGCGVLWKLTPSGGGYSYAKIHNFAGGTNGGSHAFSLTLATDGNLYGVAIGGGANGYGIIWKYDLTYNSFYKLDDTPVGFDTYQSMGLTQVPTSFTGGAIDFWGASTLGGANGGGMVYKIGESTSFSFTTVYDFDPYDGMYTPLGDLVFSDDVNDGDSGGVFYGIAAANGGFFRIGLSGTPFTDYRNDPGKWWGDDPDVNPWGIVKGSISGTPVIFGSSESGGADNAGWIWHVMDI